MDRNTPNLNKTLSIRISTNGFCFCSYTASQPDSLQYYSYSVNNRITLAANLDEALKECPFVNDEANMNVSIIVETDRFTTIPNEYDNKSEHAALFRTCFPQVAATDRIIANRLPAQGVTLLFAIDEKLYDRLCSIGNATFYSPISILLGFLEKQSIGDSKYMLACCDCNSMLLLSMSEGKLQLANSFKSDDMHDHAFYLLSIWKEHKLQQESDTLYICGDKGVEDITPILNMFIQNTKRINPNELFRPNLLNRITKIPFDLQALLLCE